MTVDRLIIAALACWRISSLFVYEDGPFAVFMHIRSLTLRIGGELTKLMTCVWCFSVWAGIVVTLLALSDYWWALLPFALSAVAIGMERYVRA